MSVVMPPPPPPTRATPPARPWSAKDTKAEAKAATARLKALRPWYRKKRFIFTVAVAAVIGIMVAQSGSKNDSTKLSSPTVTVSGVDKGIGSADASADVTGAVLGQPDATGFRAVTLTVTNNSSKRSNYLIDLSIESANGAIQYETSFASVNNLEPGQTTTVDSLAITKTVPVDAVVRIKTVSRLASN
jgi:hypothetical protein